GQWYPSEWESYLVIDVSEDGTAWERAARHATMRQDQDILYWEFGQYYPARFVRITLASKDDRLHEDFGIQDIQVFALPEGVEPPERHEAPADGGQEFAYVPTEETVNRAQELALAHGLVVAQWATSDGYAAGSLDAREFEHFARPTAQFYDPDFGNTDFMAFNPEATWGIAKAPAGGNGIQDAGDPHEYIPEAMRPYQARYIDAQYGDEGQYSSAEVDAFARWFEFSRDTYPQAITHSNQNSNPTWADLENFRHYVRTAKPDLASFDHYYWGGGDVFGSHGPAAWDATNHLLGLGVWRTQRQVALEGLTGDGSEPILFGQYLDAFDLNGSQSQKAIVTSLSLASGMKWLSLFRIEINRYDGNSFFDIDGAPTRAYWETSDILHRARQLGRFLVPLTNDWVAIQPGEHREDGTTVTNSVPSGFRLGSLEASLPELSEYGIARMEVENVGTANDGLPGDVALGFFSPLPGLTDSQAKEVFGAEDPRAFMLVNGLISNAELPSTKKLVRYDEGQYWQTAQEITLVLTPPAGAELMQVDQHTGEAERVKLTRTPVGEHGKGHEHELSLTVTIGGGKSELFYWTSPALTVSTEENPTVIGVGGSGTVPVTLTNAGAKRTKKITMDPVAPEGWALEGTWPRELGALKPGASTTVDLELSNEGVSGDAVIDLGLRIHKVSSSAAITVRGECSGELIVPTPYAVDSEETDAEDGSMGNVADEDPSTFWRTQWSASSPGYPHWIVLDLGSSQDICSLRYLPRQDAAMGRVKDYAVYVSEDPEQFPDSPTASGTLPSDGEEKSIGVLAQGRYLKFEGTSSWDGKPFMVAASLAVSLG
ncbi:MAG: discoidin domain-containing protein, partial [Brachybacterium sp.]|nr:discoidin domain-containing protein [Brachybacterium sp.]